MVRYYLHVDDCAEIVTKLIKEGAIGKYNLIGPDKFNLRQLIELAETLLNIKFQTFFNNIPSWDNTLDINDKKAQQYFNLKFKNSISNSFKSMLNK
jgi:nucleoside-diphosphate-sugar epimerase